MLPFLTCFTHKFCTAMPPKKKLTNHSNIINHLLTNYGTLYSEALDIHLSSDDPNSLFQWLVASVLYSARIRHDNATRALKVLLSKYPDPQSMKDATWKERVDVLNQNGYARYDEVCKSIVIVLFKCLHLLRFIFSQQVST